MRESCETDEVKLMRALGMGGNLTAATGGGKDKDKDKASIPASEGKANSKALRGYGGFLALLYAFTEQPNGSEVKSCVVVFGSLPVHRLARCLGRLL